MKTLETKFSGAGYKTTQRTNFRINRMPPKSVSGKPRHVTRLGEVSPPQYARLTPTAPPLSPPQNPRLTPTAPPLSPPQYSPRKPSAPFSPGSNSSTTNNAISHHVQKFVYPKVFGETIRKNK